MHSLVSYFPAGDCRADLDLAATDGFEAAAAAQVPATYFESDLHDGRKSLQLLDEVGRWEARGE